MLTFVSCVVRVPICPFPAAGGVARAAAAVAAAATAAAADAAGFPIGDVIIPPCEKYYNKISSYFDE